MYLIDRYLEKVDFENYQDFSANLKYKPVSVTTSSMSMLDLPLTSAHSYGATIWVKSTPLLLAIFLAFPTRLQTSYFPTVLRRVTSL